MDSPIFCLSVIWLGQTAAWRTQVLTSEFEFMVWAVQIWDQMIDWASICPVSYNTSGVWKRERPDIRINFKKKKKRKIQIKCLTENMSIINTKKVKLIVCKFFSVLVMIRIYWFCLTLNFLKGFGNKITIVYLWMNFFPYNITSVILVI